MTNTKQHITNKVNETIEKVNEMKITDDKISPIEIRFNLTGRSAGMFCIRPYGKRYVRFNIDMAEINRNEFDQTVVHEIAHYVAFEIYGNDIKSHGREWKKIMRMLGYEPSRCHSYTMPDSVLKNRIPYECSCQEFQFTKIRHNRSQKHFVETGRYGYVCRKCNKPIMPKIENKESFDIEQTTTNETTVDQNQSYIKFNETTNLFELIYNEQILSTSKTEVYLRWKKNPKLKPHNIKTIKGVDGKIVRTLVHEIKEK